MQKKLRRISALLLSAIMVVGIMGCGSNNNSAGTTDSSSDESQQTNNEDVQQPDAGSSESGAEEEENVSFSVFGAIWDPYVESSAVLDKWQEDTNTTIDFEWAQVDSIESQLAAKVSARELPDVVVLQYSSSQAVIDMAQSLIDEGVLVPITDYLETDCSNFMGLLSEEDMASVTNFKDGEVYGMGLIMDLQGAMSTAIRSDWLTNLGLDYPETWEDWVNVWTRFKAEDANGNGNANDEIPLAIAYSNFYMLESIFGINSNGYFSVEDEQYIYDPENPKYEAFLDGMRQLYEDGILYQEYITCDAAQLSTIGSNNTLGSMVNWAEQAKLLSLASRESDEDALFSCVTPITGPNGDAGITARVKFQQSTYFTVAALESGKLERILRAFDYLYSDEGILTTNYGIEGEMYEMVDGKPVIQAPYNTDFATARSYDLIPSILPFCFKEDAYMQYLLGGQSYDDLDDTGKSFVDGLNVNSDYFYSKAPVFSTDAYVEYFDLVEQQISLRDQYIMGKIDKDTYNKQYQELKDAGLQQVIDEAAAAYATVTQ